MGSRLEDKDINLEQNLCPLVLTIFAEPAKCRRVDGLARSDGRPYIHIQSYFALQEIAILTGDFDFMSRWKECVDEVSAEIRLVIVSKEKQMTPRSCPPAGARLDSNRA